jgi:glycosyltransferase involved in cell wall biosynthesis
LRQPFPENCCLSSGETEVDTEKNRSLWIINHHATGPGRHENFARELSARGWRVRLFASSFVHNAGIELKEYPPGRNCLKENLRGIDRVWFKTPPYWSNRLSRVVNHLAFAYRSAKAGLELDPPAAVIGSSPHLLTGLAAWYLAQKNSVPFIFEIRDIWPRSLVDIGAVRRLSPFTLGMGALEKFLYRKACRIVSALPGGEDHVAGLGIAGNKVVYIPNGVDVFWFDRSARENSLRADLEALFFRLRGCLVFTYAGAHGYANGLETVIRAAKRLHQPGKNEIHFLMLGDGPAKDGLVEEARRQDLANVTFLNAMDKEMVPAILQRTDVCLFHLRNSCAYRYGLSSNKLFDYMAAARPIVAAVDVQPVPGFTRFGLQVHSDDPDALARAILQIARVAPEKRMEMGRHARNYAEQHHDVPVLVDKLEQVLKSL